MPMYSTTHRRSQTLSPVRNERSYHTLTTTHTRTNSTERPFVAVKRAHENAKMQTIGSAPLSVLNASPHGHIAQAQQQQSPPTTVTAAAVTATAPSPSPSMASTTVEQHQHGSSNASSSSSPPINNGHHPHHQHHHQHEHHVSFDSSTLSQQNGLLSLADQDHSTPKHGHVRLESEQIIFSNIDCLNNLDTSEKLNNLLKDITNSAAAVQRAAKSNGHAPLASIPAAIPAATTSSVVTSTTSNNPSAATSNTFATTTTSSNNTTTTINHHHLPNHQARSINNHTHSNHYQNGHRRPPAPEPMDISPTSADNGRNNCLRIGEDPSVLTSSGQLALDKLLASLALENDVTEQHLAKINQQQQLSAVIANLTEYNLSEAQRLNVYNGNDLGGDAFRTHADIVNGNGFHHHHHHQNPLVNGRTPDPGGLLINNHVRRIASESDSTISSISPSLSERSNAISWCDQAREESFSSYRSETEPDTSPAGGSPRPETPAFPVTPRTPYGLSNGSSSPALPPKSPTSQRKYNSTWSLRSQKSTVSTYDVSKDLFTGSQQRSQHEIINQNDAMSCYTSRRNSTTSNANSEPQEVAPQFVKFARDSSKYWYKPNISREEAIALLRNAPPGTFVVRDSTTFANAYGLVVKVAHPPPGVQSKGPNSEELVRHFLVEPTIRGVRLKGCSNEPVFTSLSALVYQHSITPLALPCRLIIPDTDLQQTDFQSPAQQQLLMQGAACNVLYLFTCDTESLTGPQAIRKAVGLLLSARPLPKPTQVHFKVSIQGITLTDNTRQLFFRRHYPSNNVSFCSLDPDEHRWSIPSTTGDIPSNKRIFAFVAKRSPTSADNQCHVFCELEITQPASAIVSFANKVVLGGTGGQQPAPTRAI
nr:myb-like protein A [Aedes albopictus]